MKNTFPRVALLLVSLACWGGMVGTRPTPADAQADSRVHAPALSENAVHSQSPDLAQASDLPKGQQLLLDAVRRTEAHLTVSSRMRVRVQLLGQPLIGSGEYAQLRASQGLLLRLELAIQAGGQSTRVKQVSDGRHLWVHRHLGTTETLSHIDLLHIQRVFAGARLTEGTPLTSEKSILASSLAMGGLPGLLARLADAFDFDSLPLRRSRLSEVPTWTAIGVWKPGRLSDLAPHAVREGRIDYEKLPLHLPHRVEVQLGQRDLFPYKLIYQRWENKEGRPRVVPAVTAEFFEVALGEELDVRQFVYQRPTNVSVIDETHRYLGDIPDSSARRNLGDFRY